MCNGWTQISPCFCATVLVAILISFISIPNYSQGMLAPKKNLTFQEELKGKSFTQMCTLAEIIMKMNETQREQTNVVDELIFTCILKLTRNMHSEACFREIFECMYAYGYFDFDKYKDLREFCLDRDQLWVKDMMKNCVEKMKEVRAKPIKIVLPCVERLIEVITKNYLTTPIRSRRRAVWGTRYPSVKRTTEMMYFCHAKW